MNRVRLVALLILGICLLVVCEGGRPARKPSSHRRSATDTEQFKAHARERLDLEGGLSRKAPGVKCVVHYDVVVFGEQFRVDLYVNDRRDRHEGYVLEMDLPFLWEVESVEGGDVELSMTDRKVLMTDKTRLVSPGYAIDDLQVFGTFKRSPRYIAQPSVFKLDFEMCQTEGDLIVVENPYDFAKGVNGIGFFGALWWVMSTTLRLALLAGVSVGLWILVKTKRWLVNKDPGGIGARKRAESDCDTHAASFAKTLEGVQDQMAMLSPRSAGPSTVGLRHVNSQGSFKPMSLVA